MKLSMMSYTMARQKQHFNLKDMLDLTVELELDGIDFVTLHNTDAEKLRRMVDDRGIPVVCHTFFADLNHGDPGARRPGLEACKCGLEAANILGAPVVMIPTLPGLDMDRDTARANWIAGLREALPLAQAAGVTLTIENFPGAASPFVIADDLLEAVAAAPGLKITYDNGNAASGEEPAESFRRCAEHVVHAHFKDWDVQAEEADDFRPMLDGRAYRSALIGEGFIDHRTCLQAMKQAGYDGCINIEYEGDKYVAADAMRRATHYLRGLAAEIGY
jgi:3-oxoisoapionate decarboxylase